MKVNMKRKNIILGICIVIMAAAILSLLDKDIFATSKMTAFGVFNKNARSNKENITNKNNGSILAKVNGKPIESYDVDNYLESYRMFDIKKSKRELVDKIIMDILLIDEAEKTNITVSDEDIDREINLIKESLLKDDKTYKGIKEFMIGSQLSEDEYWEMIKPIYRKRFTIGKLKNIYLREKFVNSNPDINPSELDKKFEVYFNEFKEDLIKKAKIEYFID